MSSCETCVHYRNLLQGAFCTSETHSQPIQIGNCLTYGFKALSSEEITAGCEYYEAA